MKIVYGHYGDSFGNESLTDEEMNKLADAYDKLAEKAIHAEWPDATITTTREFQVVGATPEPRVYRDDDADPDPDTEALHGIMENIWSQHSDEVYAAIGWEA